MEATSSRTGTNNDQTKRKKTILLKGWDDQTFEISESAAMHSTLLKNYMLEDNHQAAFPVTKVGPLTILKVITFLNKHGDEELSDEEKKKFDEEFVSGEDMNTSRNLLMAARELEIKVLYDLFYRKITDANEASTRKQVARRKANLFLDSMFEKGGFPLRPVTSCRKRTVILKGWDEKTYEITQSAAMLSTLFTKCMLGDDHCDGFPVTKVGPITILKVIEFLSTYGDDELSTEEKRRFCYEFVSCEDRNSLLKLLRAAQDLEIQVLYDLVKQKITDTNEASRKEIESREKVNLFLDSLFEKV